MICHRGYFVGFSSFCVFLLTHSVDTQLLRGYT